MFFMKKHELTHDCVIPRPDLVEQKGNFRGRIIERWGTSERAVWGQWGTHMQRIRPRWRPHCLRLPWPSCRSHQRWETARRRQCRHDEQLQRSAGLILSSDREEAIFAKEREKAEKAGGALSRILRPSVHCTRDFMSLRHGFRLTAYRFMGLLKTLQYACHFHSTANLLYPMRLSVFLRLCRETFPT